jgi:hypothetical protein
MLGVGLHVINTILGVIVVVSQILTRALLPLFYSGFDFKVFIGNIMRLLMLWLQKVVILTLKKSATSSTTFLFRG